MRNYNFSFSSSYIGYWSVESLGENIPGTLHIDKYSIWLELFWNERKVINIGKVKLITGYAYSSDNTNKTCYYFKLKEVYLNYLSSFGKHQSQYKFNIGSLFLSDKKEYNINKVNNACIRTRLLDEWVWDYLRTSYEYDQPIGCDRFSLSFTPRAPLTLFEDDNIKVYIHFGFGCSTPNESGFLMTTRAFINIYYKQETLSFENSLDSLEYLSGLFSLLVGNSANPDFMEFRCEDAVFINKRSPQSSYYYFNVENTTTRTSILDFFEEQQFNQKIISNWLSFSNRQKYAIKTYLETLKDEHIPPSSLIRNYISVIEGLSDGISIPSTGQQKGTKKEIRVTELLNKTQGLTPNEKNEIKMLVIRESPKQPKQILKYILDKLQNIIDVHVESGFYEKAVNTRNDITHTNDDETKKYSKSEYWDVSVVLENTIAAYLLLQVGVKEQTIQKIVPEIKM